MSDKTQEIFTTLLELHKKLLESQKTEYETEHGPISSANIYFQLVVSHEDFNWLRLLSALLAKLDEGADPLEEVILEIKQLLFEEANSIFTSRLNYFLEQEEIFTIFTAIKKRLT